MSMPNEKITLRVNYPHKGTPAGETVTVDAIAPGVPADRFWRRRLKDGGAEIVTEEETPAAEEGVDATSEAEPTARKQRGSNKNS